MKIFHSYQDFSKSNITSVVTIGTFDGVHLGHQEIIKKLIFSSKKSGNESVILTFFPHPRIVLQKGNGVKLLNTIDEKIALLEKNGLDNLIVQPFTKEFSRLTSIDFVREVLLENLKTQKLIIGYDHRFGRNREGNFDQLQEYSKLFDFELEEIPAKDLEDITISSTKIRNALEKGKVEKVNSYLGYNYILTGKVVQGKALGRQYNYPTINLDIQESYKLIPKPGVYIVVTQLENEHYFGLMNIGNRPTVDGSKQTVEVHVLDYNGNLYGEKIQVGVLKRLRDEKKFDSLKALFSQIKRDEFKARQLIKSGKISF